MTCLLVVRRQYVDICLRLREWLEALGYEVITAESLHNTGEELLTKPSFILNYAHDEIGLISEMVALAGIQAILSSCTVPKTYFLLGEEARRCHIRCGEMLRFGMGVLGVAYYTDITRLKDLEIILPKPDSQEPMMQSD